MSKNRDKILIPLIAIALGILLGVIILIASGKNPMDFFAGLLRAGTGIKPGTPFNLRYPGEFLVTTMPLVLTGLAIGFAYRCGMFNIGSEGQVIMGSLFAAVFATLAPIDSKIGVVLAVIIGGIGGALWAFIPGILKVKFNISEVVSGIMLNYTALYSANYFLRNLPGADVTRTLTFRDGMLLRSDFLSSITNNSRFHWGFIVVIIALVAYWFIIEKTSFGYALRATGFNKDAAKYAGIKDERAVIQSIMISGLLAGLAGSLLVLGTFGFGRVMTNFEFYGFDGIAVALVGNCNAIGIGLGAMLFGLLKVAEPILQTSGIPREVAQIVSSSIIFFVALQYAIKYVLDKIRTRKVNKTTKVAKEGNK